MTEDFDDGLGRAKGKFQPDNNGVKFHKSQKWRNNVMELQKNGKATTASIDVSERKDCRIKMDLYLLRHTSQTKMCAEYSTDNGKSFNSASCYTHGSTNCNGGKCNNKRWFKDLTTSPFSVKGNKNVQLRLASYARNNKQDSLFDRIVLECK
jgi:hypothetical protein